MKPWKVALILIVLVLLMGGCVAVTMMGGMQAAREKQASEAKANETKVERGDVDVTVIETGSLETESSVEVRSRVGGRIAKMMVDEGDHVKRGDLIAVIDPQETELQVKQNRAQVRGANANITRINVEIAQRRITARTNLERARLRVQQLNTELKAQPTISNATVRAAETAVATARKGHELLTQVTQPNAKTQVETAKLDAANNRDKAETELNRQRALYDKGYVSHREVEQAELTMQLAETKLRQATEALQRLDAEQKIERDQSQDRIRQAQADLDRAKANSIVDTTKKQQYQQAVQDLRDAETGLRDIDALIAQRAGSQATVEQLSSALQDAERQLSETQVRAPIDGVVTLRDIEVGELVSPQSGFSQGTTIVKIEDRSAMLVKLQINEIDVAKLKEGMAADITVDALPKQKFGGTVSKIAPAMIQSGTGGALTNDPVVKYEVEVRLNNVVEAIKSGMSAKCEMKVVDRSNVLRLPLEFVGEDSEGSYVMVKDATVKPKMDPKTGKMKSVGGKRTEITTGVQNTSFVEVLSGIKEGETIVRPEYKGPPRQGMMQFGGGSDEEETKTDEKK